MNNELNHIFSGPKEISQEKLLAYLNGELSHEERNEVEQYLAEADFEQEALEGLQQVHNPQHLPLVMNELNKELIKKLKKKRNRAKIKKPELFIPAVTTIIILFLILMLFLYIRRHM